MYTLFVLAIGIVIGWNVPQPAWAKALQDKIVDFVRNLMDGSSNRP